MKEQLLEPKDRAWIVSRGLDPDRIEEQLLRFKIGAKALDLVGPAVPGGGIVKFTGAREEELIAVYHDLAPSRKIYKFVPASGAASRMFQVLHGFMEDPGRLGASRGDDPDGAFLEQFIQGLKEHRFAFYEDLKGALAAAGLDLEAALEEGDYLSPITYLLGEKGLGYAGLPKALLKFHHYGDCDRTPLEEHLVEGAAYARSGDGVVHIHLTVSPEFEDKLRHHVEAVLPRYETGDTRFEIDFSHQKRSTDTVAVDRHNRLLREADGGPMFRPGGHGALIENVNDLDGDILFIKNIDNVAAAHLGGPTVRYKKILGGYLLELQERVFDMLQTLERGPVGSAQLERIATYAKDYLNLLTPGDYPGWSEEKRRDFWINKLNRPLRVCGMVQNSGEPGGGPFWVRGKDGIPGLHIVEGAQIDKNSPRNVDILAASTHFNPVDLVCGVGDYKGNKFDLLRFVDPGTYFISEKSKAGKTLKAMELPGLWNGAMADWITVFVEVPASTFNPVKTVNDLLRPAHLGGG